MDLDNFSNKKYKIKEGIPRFVVSENFTSSFGLQWNQFQKTQLDSHTNTTMSEDQLELLFQCPWNQLGIKIIEAARSRRFTEVLLKYGAIVYSFDLSNAVSANYK